MVAVLTERIRWPRFKTIIVMQLSSAPPLGAGVAHYLRPQSSCWRRQRHRADGERLVSHAGCVSTQYCDRPNDRVPRFIQRNGGPGGTLVNKSWCTGRHGDDGLTRISSVTLQRSERRTGAPGRSRWIAGLVWNDFSPLQTQIRRRLCPTSMGYQICDSPRQFDWIQRRFDRDQLERRL